MEVRVNLEGQFIKLSKFVAKQKNCISGDTKGDKRSGQMMLSQVISLMLEISCQVEGGKPLKVYSKKGSKEIWN